MAKKVTKKTEEKKSVATKSAAKKSTVKAAVKKTTKSAVKKTASKSTVTKKPSKVVSKKKTTPKKGKESKQSVISIGKMTVVRPKKNTEPFVITTGSGIEIKGYTPDDLAEFKELIIRKRDEIVQQLQLIKEQIADPNTGIYINENSPYSLHMAEQGTDAQEREKLFLWAQRESKFLRYLEAALQRIEIGTYGVCVECMDVPKKLCKTCPLIPKERLRAVPHTQHCVEVKKQLQK
jgi:RNA polymerase-binding transcription factor DksA